MQRFEEKNPDLYVMSSWTTGLNPKTRSDYVTYRGRSLDRRHNLVVTASNIPAVFLGSKEEILSVATKIEVVQEFLAIGVERSGLDELPSDEPPTSIITPILE